MAKGRGTHDIPTSFPWVYTGVWLYTYECMHMQIQKSEYLLNIDSVWFITIYVNTVYREKGLGAIIPKMSLMGFCKVGLQGILFFLWISQTSNVLGFVSVFLEKMLDLNALSPRGVPWPCTNIPTLSQATSCQPCVRRHSRWVWKSPAVSFSHSDCSQNKNEFFHGNLQPPQLDAEATLATLK